MTLEDFKIKWVEDIGKGIVIINEKYDTIIADRFDGKNFLCDRKHINKIQTDIRKLGYIRIGIGVFGKDFSGESMLGVLSHYLTLSKVS